ncbi:MAG: O-antigen ligase family protein [Acidobacteriota bacterium]
MIARPFPLLALTLTLPLWLVAWGGAGSPGFFVLYRAPKLAALQVLLWLLLLALAWHGPGLPSWRRLGRDPVLALTALFLAYGALSLLWAPVAENGFYELCQWLPLLLLLAALRHWLQRDPKLADRIIRIAVLALVPVLLISVLQRLHPLPWLPAIAPQLGVAHASLLGYKNPLALTLLGQIFLLAYLAFGRERPRPVWLALLAFEIILLTTLRSRTVMVALLLTAAAGSVLLVLRGRRRQGAVLAVVGLVFISLLASLPAARQRAATIPTLLGDYWSSDRGVYFRNTLAMVRQHSAGVGLGNWQSVYPVFRSHDRYRSFDDEFRVRRAHSDHVQILGETGWPGLLCWLLLLAWALAASLRAGPRALFIGLQILALGLAMGTDYVLDLPYSKLQLVVLLALLPGPREGAAASGRRALRWLVPLAAGGILLALSLALKSHRGAHFQAAFEHQRSDARELGESFARLPGHDKTFHRHLLALAQLRWQDGEPRGARDAAWRALELHPYDPTTLRLLAILTRPQDPLAAAALEDGAAYVLHEATNGYRKPYPRRPSEDSFGE